MSRRNFRGAGRFSNVQKPIADNVRFDSGDEKERYLELKVLQRVGNIKKLELQPRFPIEFDGVKIMQKSKRYHKNGRQVVYVADFRYFDLEAQKTIIEDVKMKSGYRDPVYKLKKALVEAMGYHITEV